ncbi:MAG TPA: glutamine-hydrolyzing carbamoyl-phosphate synthase small subunit [Actinomycetota bacterium]|nr:glutamine-hydrolyzing carbamoyl-phosphate synthase small subunit [Actinomycetota bacterium]
MRERAVLALEDGTTFSGESFGAAGVVTGEACFNTGMTGYQEVLTDPSYCGQIVTMTATQIGNTGANSFDDQAPRPWVRGFAVRELSETVSSWRAESTLDEYLRKHGIPGITGIDTRRLTRHLRTRGAMRAALGSGATADELVDVARSAPSMAGADLVVDVTTATPYQWTRERVEERRGSGFVAGAEEAATTAALMAPPTRRYRIAAYDFGVKHNILDLLVAAGCDVTVVPATTPANDVLDGGFDGVFLANGPGDPAAVTYGVEAVRGLVGRIPVFGICLGHQILGLALGAETFKLPFGHRGSNHPVKRLGRDRIEITCQNHGFAVDPRSLERTPATLTHLNLNDETVEGLEVPGVAFSVQYHPESGPGPHDSRYLFGAFRDLMETFEPARADAVYA